MLFVPNNTHENQPDKRDPRRCRGPMPCSRTSGAGGTHGRGAGHGSRWFSRWLFVPNNHRENQPGKRDARGCPGSGGGRADTDGAWSCRLGTGAGNVVPTQNETARRRTAGP
ncbi:hypothetical protein Acy02nite_60000 [Actinoplanes cyaneus]|uniref:Uncharacterized protein n=1 Tax=Actinoplanes cyaneus TaxID=52696 RepID=A0A919MA17_9ACTN|nr:hypothetical protein Acy02nite_60000 [Actinoplanes cyaneus]